MDVLLDDVVAETPREVRQKITARLSAAAASTGYFWALARRHCGARAGGGGDGEPAAGSFAELEEKITGSGFVHSMQVSGSVRGAL